MASRSKWTGIILAAALVALAILGAWGLSLRAVPGVGNVRAELRDRGRVVYVGRDDLGRLSAPGTTLVRANEIAGLTAAMQGNDSHRVAQLLSRAGVRSLLVDTTSLPAGDNVQAHLAHMNVVDGFVAQTIAPAVVLYAVQERIHLSEARLGDALATVARRVLSGEAAPQLSSFPDELQRGMTAEVMVKVVEGEQARMWRSSRGSSIAEGLLIATDAVRDRWHEREQAMHESLAHALTHMRVDVHVLEEDGTFDEPAAAVIDRATTEEHGIGYALRDQWEYALPERVRADGGGAHALRALMLAHSLPETAFARADMRVYRFSVTLLGRSLPPLSAP